MQSRISNKFIREKYTELLIQKRYSYIVYYFDQEKEELQILEDYEGKNRKE